MKDSDKILTADLQYALPGYSGQFGYPTFGDVKQYLPDYFSGDWEEWDLPNKSSVILRWHGRQEDLAQQRLWQEEDRKVLARIESDEQSKKQVEEQKRLARVSRQESESARRAHGASIVAQQTACSERKRIDNLVEQANDYIANVSKLVATLRGIPAARLHEVDTDSLFFNCGRVKKIIEPTAPGQISPV